MLTRTLQTEAIQAREADDGTATIAGVAVPWNDPIVYAGIQEQFQRGAIDPEQAVGQPLFMNHDRGKHIGVIVAAEDTERGLEVEATIQPTADGRDAMLLLRSGALRGLSVGFEPMERDQNPTGVTYTRAHLHELSTTPLQAYPNAQVTEARHEETQTMPDTTAPDTPAVRDLGPDLDAIATRVADLEARHQARGDAQAGRTVGVVEAFTRQLQDWTRTKGQVRALADVLSSGNAGLLPAEWSREVTGYVDAMRYTIRQAGTAAFPSSGTSLTVPSISQHTLVDPRGTEKTEPPSRALTTTSNVYSIEWFAGAVDIAMELVEQSDPAVLGVVVQDLLAVYAGRVDARAHEAAVAAATHSGAALDTSSYAALLGDLITNGEAIRAATGQFGNKCGVTTADWTAILGLGDADGRRVLATSGGTNADGSARLDSSAVDIGGVIVFHQPRANTSVQFNETSYRVAEKAPTTLQQPNVSLLGVDVGVLGAILPLPLYPAGIISYEV